MDFDVIIIEAGVVGLACSDTVASLAGIDIDKAGYKLNYARGHYFRLKSSKKDLAKHLIYSVPPNNFFGLGVNITVELSGDLKLGPDVQYLKKESKITPFQ